VAARASSCAASSSSGTMTSPPPPSHELPMAPVAVMGVEAARRDRVIGVDRADTGHRTVRTPNSARQPTHRAVAQHPRGEEPSGVGVPRREAAAAAAAVEAARTTAASDAAKRATGQASVPAPRSPYHRPYSQCISICIR
jgi:hypothetical protein